MDSTAEKVIALWESASSDSDAGRFHEAIVGFERARRLLEEARSGGGEPGGGSNRVCAVLEALLERVRAELTDHVALLEGNHFLALGLKRGAAPKTTKKAWRAFALLYHPDKTRKVADTSALFRAGQAAHESLSDPDRAAAYMPNVRPEQWLACRAAETRRLAVLERRQQAAVGAAAQPKAAEATAAAESFFATKNSHRSRGGWRWLRVEELSALKVGELVAQLAAVGLAGAVRPGSERAELERVYLAAAATARSSTCGSKDSEAGSRGQQPPLRAADRHGAGKNSNPGKAFATQAQAKEPSSKKQPSEKAKATSGHAKMGTPGIVPEPPVPRPEGGLRVTKEALRRHEERMFGRRRATAAGGLAANVNISGAEGGGEAAASTASPPPPRKEHKEDKSSSSNNNFASGGDIAAAYSAAYAAGSCRGEESSNGEGAEWRRVASLSSLAREAFGRPSAAAEDDSEQKDLAPRWGRPKAQGHFLDSEDDEDAESLGEAEVNVTEKVKEATDNFGYESERSPAGADPGVALQWGRARHFSSGGSDSEDEDDEDEDGGDVEWNFAFDVTLLRWGGKGRNENDVEDKAYIDKEIGMGSSTKAQSPSKTLRDLRDHLSRRQRGEEEYSAASTDDLLGRPAELNVKANKGNTRPSHD